MKKEVSLEKQIKELREKVESELLSKEKDNKKLLKLSAELDALILLYYKNNEARNIKR